MPKQEHGIKWEQAYELGEERIDSQHRKLFALLDMLIAACEDGSAVEKAHEALDFLVDYTVQHFNDEEVLQLQYGYPDYEIHKQMHDNFKVTVAGLVERFHDNSSSAELSNDINKIVVRWLVSHIQREDKKIADHIRQSAGTEGVPGKTQ